MVSLSYTFLSSSLLSFTVWSVATFSLSFHSHSHREEKDREGRDLSLVRDRTGRKGKQRSLSKTLDSSPLRLFSLQ